MTATCRRSSEPENANYDSVARISRCRRRSRRSSSCRAQSSRSFAVAEISSRGKECGRLRPMSGGDEPCCWGLSGDTCAASFLEGVDLAILLVRGGRLRIPYALPTLPESFSCKPLVMPLSPADPGANWRLPSTASAVFLRIRENAVTREAQERRLARI